VSAHLRSSNESPVHEKVALPSIYRTPKNIFDTLAALASSGACATHLSVDHVSDPDRPDKHLVVARLGDPFAEKHVLVVANMHAREAVTAEVAVAFIERVCGVQSPTLTRDESSVGCDDGGAHCDRLVLPDGVAVTVVPVVNVGGRALVDGRINSCQRATADEGEGEIDLNRNADVDFIPGENHGPRPFSAYQTRILRRLSSDSRVVAYVDLHSGTKALLTSWGDQKGVSVDFPAQQKLLKRVASKSCPECVIGSNRIVVNYPNPGEVIDHMYAKRGIKYATLWEIYRGEPNSSCIAMFNPPADRLPSVVRRWSDGVHELVQFVQKDVRVDDRAQVMTDEALHKRPMFLPGIATIASPFDSTVTITDDWLTA